MKYINKTTIFLVIFGLLTAGVIIGYNGFVKTTASTEYTQLGNLIKQNRKDPNSAILVLKVNNIGITKLEYENQKDMLQMMNPNIPVTDAEVESKIISFTALYQEAQKRGLEASREEAKKYAEAMKMSLENAITDPDNAPDNSQLILEYINGTGQSLEQFFSESTNGYRKMLSVANLRKSVYEETAKNLPEDIELKEKQKLQEEAFNKLKDKVTKSSVVEHIN